MRKPLKIFLTVVLFMSLARPSFAQNNVEGMKLLTVYALMHYGLSLYDRGDYYEASNVFNHILSIDGHQAQAMKYLKEMGYAPMPGFAPIPRRPDVEDFEEAPVKIDFSDNDSLKKAIEAKTQAIQKLRVQINKMRAQLDAPMTNH